MHTNYDPDLYTIKCNLLGISITGNCAKNSLIWHKIALSNHIKPE